MNKPSAERMSALKTVLLWEGEIDNPRIRELFGVQSVWASRLLSELASTMGHQASRATAYAPLKLSERASARSKRQSPEEYLRIVGAAGTTFAEGLLEDARLDLSVVAPGLFATIVQAIRTHRGLRVSYRSMNHPEGTERIVFPHALVHAPRRWHLRAWCAERKDFRDFTIGRIASAEHHAEPAPHDRIDDAEWNDIVRFSVVAHPGLSPEQQAMIAAEYFPGATSRELEARRCLVGYIIQDLRLATNPETQKPPEYQLLVSDAQKLGSIFSTQ